MIVYHIEAEMEWTPFRRRLYKYIFSNENVWIPIKISLNFVHECAINNIPTLNIPTLVQIMAWRRPGDKPLSEPMMVSLPMHRCVTRPQWVIGYTVRLPVMMKKNGWMCGENGSYQERHYLKQYSRVMNRWIWKCRQLIAAILSRPEYCNVTHEMKQYIDWPLRGVYLIKEHLPL